MKTHSPRLHGNVYSTLMRFDHSQPFPVIIDTYHIEALEIMTAPEIKEPGVQVHMTSGKQHRLFGKDANRLLTVMGFDQEIRE